ncbi:YkoF family thiamine/hydroxymethylpyrimidine-binding protein [Virgibacillus halophilus]|uniref:YkoF family thiamine/hydroxymethylpyrimidine-binding protein n=1 Tax=Tigheibacillus halophilus TaxID=361280 RepID=A0ABU5C9L6_9BACI|nr:YkoF family thiamine/hydroxymethylpyrimidine-binding protein [Virgibacillus halophilus]
MSNEACHSGEIVGVSFSLHPMCNQFIDIILGTLEKVDSTKVWMRTDDVTTTIRGKAVHVFDVSKAIFIIAAQTGEHIAYQATYSIGCPGDAAGDVYLAEDDEPANLQAIQNIQQEVSAKFSLYPLGGVHYMDMIYKQIDAMKAYVHVSPAHYSTYLRGECFTHI